MARIHDWGRKYWINAAGEREYNPDDEDFPDEVLSEYANSNDDRITLRRADEEADHKYEVLLNGELLEDVPLGGDEEQFNYDGDEITLEFGTRAEAREACSDLQRMLPQLEEDEDGEYDYDALRSWAKVVGVKANQGKDELTQQLVQH